MKQRIEPALNPVPETALEDQLDDLIKMTSPPEKRPREITQFERLGEELANALVAAAQDMLTESENKLNEVKAWAEQVKQEVRARAIEHENLVQRFKDFGGALLEAHDKFHNGDRYEQTTQMDKSTASKARSNAGS